MGNECSQKILRVKDSKYGYIKRWVKVPSKALSDALIEGLNKKKD